jgi:hypothetical protein
MPAMIRIWKFRDAPQHLQDLYPRGNDSTWVIEAPAGMGEDVEHMIAECSQLLADISRCHLHDGTVVFFGQDQPVYRRATGGSR